MDIDMLKVGMTGGIASGKTYAANLFKQLGCDIIDTDVIAHQLVEIGKPAWHAIVDHFGSEILNANQSLNRKRLQHIIFSNTNEKKWLETLLHPKIRRAVHDTIEQKVTSPYCIVIIPLLVETLPNPNINRVLVIDTDEKTQLQRAMQRDGISEQTATAILHNQASRQQRLTIADDILENNTSLTDFKLAVQKMHSFYLSMAQNAT
jgi:dephospho-CoA kinase